MSEPTELKYNINPIQDNEANMEISSSIGG